MNHSIDRIRGVTFGTSGVRGRVEEMTDLVCYLYATGFLQYARKSDGLKPRRVALGGDLRPSTPRILKAVAKAIDDFGCVVLDCGELPSPALGLLALSEKIPAIMVTGSHIAEDRNGIKFFLPEGEILKNDELGIAAETVAVPERLFDEQGAFRDGTVFSRPESWAESARRLYFDRYLDAFPPDFLQGLRIGFYEQSSVGRDWLCELYTELGAEVTRLGRSGDFIPIDTEALRSEDLRQIEEWASPSPTDPASDPTASRFNAILSADADGDRPLVFDERGRWVRGDLTGILCARFLAARSVVTPVNSNSALERCQWFSRILRTKIGSPYVLEGMRQLAREGAERIVGYEANGGFLTLTPLTIDESAKRPLSALPTRDPAIVQLGVLGAAKKSGVPLSRLLKDLPQRFSRGDRIKNFPTSCSQRKLDELVVGGADAIERTFGRFGKLTRFETIDGLRMMFGENDIIHLRPSGNAPEFRCYTESDARERAEEMLEATMQIAENWWGTG